MVSIPRHSHHQSPAWQPVIHTLQQLDNAPEIACSKLVPPSEQTSPTCQQTIAELEETLGAFFELNPLPMAIVAIASGQVLWCNQPLVALLGAPSDFSSWFAKPADYQRVVRKLHSNQSQNLRLRLKRHDGVAWARVRIKPVQFASAAAAVVLIQETGPATDTLLARAVRSAGYGIDITDAEGHLEYVNPSFEAMTGYASTDIIGESVTTVLQCNGPAVTLEQSWQNAPDERIWVGSFAGVRQDGSTFQQEATIAPITDAAGATTHYVTVRHDVTQQKQTEIRLQAIAQQQAAIADLGQRALAGSDLGLLLQEATILVAQTLGVTYCGVLELLPGGNALLLQAGSGWQQGLVGTALVGTQNTSQIGYALRVQQPIVVEDFRIDTRFSGPPILHNHRVVSGLSVSIPGREQPFGVLGCYTIRPRTFSQEDCHFLQAIANVLSTAISRKHADEQLHLMERAIAASSNAIVLTDANQLGDPIIYVNPAFEAMTGYTAAEVVGRNHNVLNGDETDLAALSTIALAMRDHQECRVTLQHYRRDGTVWWNELHLAPVFDASGLLTHFIRIQTDISDRARLEAARKRAEATLRKSEEQFRLIFELAPIGIALVTPQGHYMAVNQALCQALGYTSSELLGRHDAEISHAEDLEPYQTLHQKLLQGDLSHFQIEKRYLAAGGSVVHALVQSTLVRDADGNPLHSIALVLDISARKQMEAQLVHDAFYDTLTGLPNRLLFIDRLQQVLACTRRYPERQFAVLFLDLDRFKLVNDSLGHLVGDQLLVAIAQRLKACLRPGDTVARLGGDEFTVLLDPIENINDATTVAERIHQALSQPLNLSGHDVFTTASIGIALSTSGYEQPDDLLRDADSAMYRAKAEGKACYSVFDTAMYNHAVAQLQLETNLRWALERHELCVYYQPIVSLETEKIVGFEALLRWQHPEQGMISPAAFIPIAEETGLIIPIGQWVLREACRQLYQWQQQFTIGPALSISVNLSGKQFSQPGLTETVAKTLLETGLQPQYLRLELTESGIMQHATAAASLLERLKALGIQLAIDDFGTGYSSLNRLRQFPIDTLKIDRTFVAAMHANGENAEIVEAIVTLSHHLGMDVVAEGVETDVQFKQLKQLHCEYGQGYRFAQPLSQEMATALLATVT